MADVRPARPKACRGKARAIWERTIEPAWWLRYVDGPKAFMRCELAAELESDPARINAARIAQLRGVCSDLGFDSAAQRKIGLRREG